MSQDDLYLQHYGVLGMHWGVRRYQNKDGSLTPRGKKHQAKLIKKQIQSKVKESRKKYSGSSNMDRDRLTMKRNSLGSNWDKVYNEHHNTVAKDSELQKAQANYKKANKKYSSASTIDQSNKALYESNYYSEKYKKRYKKITNSFVKKYDTALLKDLNYKDIDAGRKILNDYNIHYSHGYYNNGIEYGNWKDVR